MNIYRESMTLFSAVDTIRMFWKGFYNKNPLE